MMDGTKRCASLEGIIDMFHRLFDHHPALSSEMQYTLQAFEGPLLNAERSLQKLEIMTKECNENLVEETCDKAQQNFRKAYEESSQALEKCDIILQKEGKTTKAEWLANERSERAERWNAFMEGMCEKSAAIDLEFTEEVNKIHKFYAEFEDKLQKASV